MELGANGASVAAAPSAGTASSAGAMPADERIWRRLGIARFPKCAIPA